jgi:hypothetical protein
VVGIYKNCEGAPRLVDIGMTARGASMLGALWRLYERSTARTPSPCFRASTVQSPPRRDKKAAPG